MKRCPECGEERLLWAYGEYGEGAADCYGCRALVKRFPHEERVYVVRDRLGRRPEEPYFAYEDGRREYFKWNDWEPKLASPAEREGRKQK